jgi:hypothetical protein
MGRPVLCSEQGKALTTLPDGMLRTHDEQGNALNVFSGCCVMAEYATLSVDKSSRSMARYRSIMRLVGCAVTTGVGVPCSTRLASYRARASP